MKITRLQANQIRERYAAGGVHMQDLAAEFGISLSMVSRIVSGERHTGRRQNSLMLNVLVQYHLFTRRNGYAPTQQEVAGVLGVTSVAVMNALRRLERRGYIERTHRKWRSIRIIRHSDWNDLP